MKPEWSDYSFSRCVFFLFSWFCSFLLLYSLLIRPFARDVKVSFSVTAHGSHNESADVARSHPSSRSHLLDIPHHDQWTNESGDFNQVYPVHQNPLKALSEEELNVPDHAAFLVSELASRVELNEAISP